MSQRRVDLCNKHPADHHFQPPIIKPLNMIPADTHTSTSTHPNKTPIRFNPTLGGTGLAEVVMSSTIQKPTRFGSPSNLFSLEKHLGGEFPNTPQKASKSVPKKIDLVNQQPPKPSQQNNLEPTSLQTKTQAQTQETTIPESVIETVVEESVPVIESEPSVSENLILSASDQPSSSYILESEYILEF